MIKTLQAFLLTLVSLFTLASNSPAQKQLVQPGSITIERPPLARSIEFVGNTIIPSSQLLCVSGLKLGQLINEEVLNRAIENVQTSYQQCGYIAAVTSIELPQVGQVGTLVFHITELRIACVKFCGLDKVKKSAVARVLTLKAGAIFSREALNADYIRLQQLGVFENISSQLEPTDQVGEAAMVWTFEELKEFNYAELGGSYSPQDSVVGNLDLTVGNLGGTAQKLYVSAMVGSVEAQAGGRIEYFNPWIAPQNTSLKLNLFSMPVYRFSQSLTSTGRYFERHSGFRGSVRRMVDRSLQITTGIRLENVTVNNLPSSELTNPTVQSGSIALANLKAERDLRNSLFRPTTGSYTIGSFEGGWSNPDSGGSGGIGKLWGDRRWYIPTRQTTALTGAEQDSAIPVLALRALLGVSAGNLPYYEQYFVGGISSLPLRGYVEGRFWGKYAMLANAEFRYPLTHDVSVVTFVDAGEAWGSSFQFVPGVSTQFGQTKNFSPRVGAGVGLRYYSPAGLVLLDTAYGDAWRTYFSVGQTF